MTVQSGTPEQTGGRVITILENQRGHLVAEQRSQNGNFLLILLLLVVLVLTAVFVWKRQWKALIVPGLALLVLAPLWALGNNQAANPTYRITVDQETHQIDSQKIVGDKTVATTTIRAGDISSAEMQFNRGARTIVLISRDGHQIFPLGEQQLQDEPDQYVILNALRQAIGQAPASPQ